MAIQLPLTLIGELLQRGIVTQANLPGLQEEAIREDKDFGQVLIDSGIVLPDQLLDLKSEIYRLPKISVKDIEFNKSVLSEISEDIVNFYKVVPLAREENTLKVGLINPEDINASEALKFIAADRNLDIEKYVIDYRDFYDLVRNYRTLTGEVGEALESLSEEETQKTKVKSRTIEEIGTEGAVTRIVASVVKFAVESRASDIHIEPTEADVRVRFRIDGALATTLTLPKDTHSGVVTRIKILSDLKIDETRLAQDGRFSTTLNKHRYDFRVSTFPTRNGEKVVMRILDPLAGKVELATLGLEGRSFEVLMRAIARPFGSILITGPTGSGKSTTLAGILREVNKEDVNIVTLEDPIEYFVEGVNQSQVHEEIGYTFASGLRHILRQDPDIIMVGEIRDRETAGLATQAALTGHIVLSTLHTNDALGVVPRLIDMSVEKYLIPSTLNVAAAQRLLRRLCSDCKIQTQTTKAEEGIINAALATMPKEYHEQLYSKDGYQIYKPNTENPCKVCGGKAFKGRIGIFEMLEMTDELEKVILGTISEFSLRQEARRQGMLTMFQDGILKVLKGLVSLEELLEVAQADDREEPKSDKS